jgi:hypothetical protein
VGAPIMESCWAPKTDKPKQQACVDRLVRRKNEIMSKNRALKANRPGILYDQYHCGDISFSTQGQKDQFTLLCTQKSFTEFGILKDPKTYTVPLRRITKVSKRIKPMIIGGKPIPLKTGRKYLKRSLKRLTVVTDELKKMGWKPTTYEFDYKKFGDKTVAVKGTNRIFKHPSNDGKAPEIWLVAHHDYIAGRGVEDDATGLAVMTALARAFKDSPLAANIVFGSFDLEEIGTAGSANFVRNNLPKDEWKRIKYVIALECLGSGKDLVVTSKSFTTVSDPTLVKKLKEAAEQIGLKVVIDEFRNFYADHVTFTRIKGKDASGKTTRKSTDIPAGHIFSINYENYKKKLKIKGVRQDSVAHTNKDLLKYIYPGNLVNFGKILAVLISKEF